MQFKTMLRLQKCMYFHFYLFITWFIVEGFFIYNRSNNFGNLTKYLSLTVYTLLIVIEAPRIYLGHYGNLSCRVSIIVCSTYNCQTCMTRCMSVDEAKEVCLDYSRWCSLWEKDVMLYDIPELAGFLMLTVLMQMPLVSFFLFNPYLNNTCMELTLHVMLWLLTVIEAMVGFMALKEASDYAKSIYLSQPRDR